MIRKPSNLIQKESMEGDAALHRYRSSLERTRGHSLWIFWAKESSQQYILMNLMHTKISFISLTRRSVIVTHFLRKYAVSLEASIWQEQKEVMTRAEERKWKREQWHYLRFRAAWEVGAGRRRCIVIDAPCINTGIYSCRDSVWKKKTAQTTTGDNYVALNKNKRRWMGLKRQKVESYKAFKL